MKLERTKQHKGKWVTDLNQRQTNAIKLRRTDHFIIISQKDKLSGRTGYVRVRICKINSLIKLLKEYQEDDS